MNGTGKEDEMEENKVPTTGAEETKTPTFDEMLSDKAMQAEYDRRMQKALNTAKEKWQAEKFALKAGRICIILKQYAARAAEEEEQA